MAREEGKIDEWELLSSLRKWKTLLVHVVQGFQTTIQELKRQLRKDEFGNSSFLSCEPLTRPTAKSENVC